MKRLFIISFLLIFSFVSAQETKRNVISGKISVPVGDSHEGITIINQQTGSGTVSSEAGTFSIRAARGDTLQFSAVQYQQFSVIVDEGIVDSGELIVDISEAIYELPEVVVSPVDLSGYVEVDVARIPVEKVDLPDMTAAEIEDTDYDFRPDDLTSPANAAMRNSMIYSGTNFADLFRRIFTPKTSDAVSWTRDVENRSLPEVDEVIEELYDDEFFINYLGIKRENIYEFIFFAQDNGLREELLEEENELDLIKFLVAQSHKYKNQ